MKIDRKTILTTIMVLVVLAIMVTVPAVLLHNRPAGLDNGRSTRFESYDQILALLKKTQASSPNRYYFGAMEKAAVADSAAPQENSAGSGTDHSTTNVQVEGVDEADIIKTDGSYLYLVANGRLLVYDVRDPAAPTLTYDQDFRSGDKRSDPMEMFLDEKNERLILINNAYEELAAVSAVDAVLPGLKMPEYYMPYSYSYVSVQVYDLNDPAVPTWVGSYDQEGYYLDSRRIDDAVYLLTDKYTNVYAEGEAEQQIPQYRVGDAGSDWVKIPAEKISVYPAQYYDSFLLISAFNTVKADSSPTFESMLGYGNTVYVSTSNIYIAASRYEMSAQEEKTVVESGSGEASEGAATSEPRPPEAVSPVSIASALAPDMAPAKTIDTAISTVPAETGETAVTTETKPADVVTTSPGVAIDRNMMPVTETTTDIYRYSIQNGTIAASGSGNVPGTILNQFAMDEKDGYLRIATTKGEAWRTDEYASTNNLYVLDASLTQVGAVEGLARTEQIKSVRFIGDRAYMVTFRTTDPLFVIDLSEPTAPAVLGELKIPGFSEYLHPYGDNLLLGFGQDAADLGDRAYTLGLKVSMFDVSDPASPKETATLYLGDRGSYTELLYNHKALLFDKESNVIGFPVSLSAVPQQNKSDPSAYGTQYYNGFVILGYSDSGFSVKGFVSHVDGANPNLTFATAAEAEAYMISDAGRMWQESIQRGVTVGDTLYTFSNSILRGTSLTTFAQTGSTGVPGYQEIVYDTVMPKVAR